MRTRLMQHLRANVVAYVALAVALGGGGGFAIAAARSTTIHACVVKKTGELIVANRCGRGERALSWNEQGPAGATGKTGQTGQTGAQGQPGQDGTTPFVASGNVGINGVGSSTTFTVTHPKTGEYLVTLNGASCAQNPNDNLVASVQGGTVTTSEGIAYYVAQASPGSQWNEFVVTTGEVLNGTYTPTDMSSDIIGTC